MPKIPEILVASQMERSVWVPLHQNIWDHFWMWSTLICPPIRFIAFLLFTYVGNSEKESQIVRAIALGWPGFSLLFHLVSDRSVWLSEKHPKLTFGLKKLWGVRVDNSHSKFWDRVLLWLFVFKGRFAIKFQDINLFFFRWYRYFARLWLLTGSWKTWKVLVFHCGIFQDWKFLEKCYWSWKVLEFC